MIKQWPFILTSNLLYSTKQHAMKEYLNTTYNKKLNTIERVALKLQRIFDKEVRVELMHDFLEFLFVFWKSDID